MEEVKSELIKLNKVPISRVTQINLNDNILMGTQFTDHMFVCDYYNGEWINPRIEPLALIPTHPAAMALHYGQAIFEGMKATRGKNGIPMLFRPKTIYRSRERVDSNSRRKRFVFATIYVC